MRLTFLAIKAGVLGLVLGALSGCSGNGEIVRGDGKHSTGGNGGVLVDSGAGGVIVIRTSDSGSGGRIPFDACTSDACMPTSVCGDGKVSGNEECDDGNAIPGDGCSGVCKIEPGYSCPKPGQACDYTVVTECGDGKIEGNEVCDDGNAQSGDGCSSDCSAVEMGYTCPAPGVACVPNQEGYCGDGMLDPGEQCDDGDKADAGSSNGDGCSADCKLELGWTCPTPGQPCVSLEYCGDGKIEASQNETCDDGNAIPGDGCSGICKTEPGYDCSMPGKPCVNIWVCGNGKVDPGESCDDGGTVSGDGCTSNCTVEPGYTCPKAADGTGGKCMQAPPNVCGDAIISGSEECDDGGTVSGDGCSSACKVEAGWTCPKAGSPCQKTAYCGNGIVDISIGEQCDDGNTKGSDGCSPLCQIEAGFACPTPGQPCVSTVKCGDGKIGGTEQCDDGNKTPGDGCNASCALETGWICPVAGARCIAKQCGDGVLAGTEQCDDGNTKSNDGCSSTCQLEQGFACTVASPSVCHATVCGDGKKEGFEQCDDKNLIPYDGCSPYCTIEPKCSSGQCTAVCGDGFKFPQEACDDGNTTNGDGCSSTCTIETGFTCPVTTLAPPASLQIPILYRDMLYKGTTIPGPGHPDFEAYEGSGQKNMVLSTLGADGFPVYNPNITQQFLTSAGSFYTWYHATESDGTTPNKYAKLIYLDSMGNPTTLTLPQITGGAYQFASSHFFPIDGLGWNAGANAQVSKGDDGVNHNFSFNSELRYQFTYKGGEVLDFTGDDDVWVFINGKLAVDLGGLHSAQDGSVTLDATTAANLGLTVGGMYEIALFQAERHTVASNYRLTLNGFVHDVSACTPICGDGIVVAGEVCDDGKNTGAYGGCMPGCQARGPYCGDKVVQNPPEKCDDGTNLGGYGAVKVCAPGCVFAPYCGDGVVSNGEACDEGATNGAGYGHCTSACTLGQRCGDGLLNGPEQCDDGINNGSTGSPCAANCTLRCGNGVVDSNEECDDGTAKNVGGYGKCNPDCTLGPRCGDGIKQPPETCDDGKNDGSYGTCKPDCTFAGYCGDAVVQNPPESCDLGTAMNSATAYGPGTCTNRCTPGPYCGDKQVDGADGELCDDGVNSGQPGSCTKDCKGFVPLNSCGDGKVQPPEQCDDGKAQNGTTSSTCDAHCRNKCGNGMKDPGEQCDNGVNDGSYGTCNANCTLAAYCGDGTKQAPEQCDNGGRNVDVSTAYGEGLCTKACTFAPFCGDGRIQIMYEECDGGPGCTPSCKKIK
ncbi:MAG TPA: DUF4215 domain-containing protein [Polyangiaceae bacterium]|nr:DUF4215 domain-containing protein [Polyangiaceae bacterium]